MDYQFSKIKDMRFRSKTEAMWAALISETGYICEYEPNTFKTPLGWYCPDFYLPEVSMYIEVKGEEPTASESEKLIDVQTKTGCHVAFLIGMPETDSIGFMNCCFYLPIQNAVIPLNNIYKACNDKKLLYIAQRSVQIGNDRLLQGFSGPKFLLHVNSPFEAIKPKSQNAIEPSEYKHEWLQALKAIMDARGSNG
ncbi:restriction endonuclease [Vibrio phage 1.232.O._10N.261.51.E11]|nr:restriction endonuclease [Vibrio phage 1.232.O._10N.261.51.E11]